MTTRVAKARSQDHAPNEHGAPEAIHVTRFVVRTPLLPVDAFVRWGGDLRAATTCSEAGALESAVEHDRRLLRDRLAEMLTDPKILEAIYLAAPGMIDGIERWRHSPESKTGQDVERSLVRYMTRMSCRATPFGLFSGLSLGSIGTEVRADLGPIGAARRRVDFDADTLYAVATACSGAPEFWLRGLLFPNTSLARRNDTFHYTESFRTDAGISYRLVSVPVTDALLRVLERAELGASAAELVEAVHDAEPDVEPSDVHEFLRELVDNDLLQSELRPSVTGVRPALAMIDSLRKCQHPAASVLSAAETNLRAMDDRDLGVPLTAYEATVAALRELHGNEHKHCFHAQLHKHGDDLRLDRATIDLVVRTAETLLQMVPKQDQLGPFKEAFVERWGDAERWVALSDVLDEERGIGFGAVGRDASPLLSGIPIANALRTSGAGSSVDPMRLALWQRAIERGEHEIALDRNELWSMAGGPHSPPPQRRQALAVGFSLARRASDGGVEVVYHNGAGPSGARVLGRFAHGHPEIDALVRDHIAAEEAEDSEVVFAEIAHVPEGKLANVIVRPVFRRFEIPCLGRSGVSPEYQLPLADLEVCVAGNRVHLRSRRLGKFVIPRLTSAHNYVASEISAYRFLTALQFQDLGVSAAWSWGRLVDVARFLPRVRIDTVVVSTAQWRIDHGELVDLRAARSPAARVAAASQLRDARRLPRYLQYGIGDQLSVLDLESSLSIDAFAHGISKIGPVALHEWYPGPDHQFVRGPEGRYEAEYFVPIVRIPRARPKPTIVPPAQPCPQTTFGPGSSWLYLKLYGGFASTEHALVTELAPLLDEYQTRGVIERWFFIRYADPRRHIRLRVQGDPQVLHSRIEPDLLARVDRLRACGSFWKVELATYDRETQRYGGAAGIHIAEQIFGVDSRACGRVLRLVGGDHDARWGVTLLGLHDILCATGLDHERRTQLLARVSEGRLTSIDPRSVSAKPIARRYRELRSRVERWLGPDVPPAIAEVMGERARALVPLAAELLELDHRAGLTRPLDTVVGDLLHMHANRMLRADANMQECILYEFLRRTYRSMAARDRVDGDTTARTPDR